MSMRYIAASVHSRAHYVLSTSKRAALIMASIENNTRQLFQELSADASYCTQGSLVKFTRTTRRECMGPDRSYHVQVLLTHD